MKNGTQFRRNSNTFITRARLDPTLISSLMSAYLLLCASGLATPTILSFFLLFFVFVFFFFFLLITGVAKSAIRFPVAGESDPKLND